MTRCLIIAPGLIAAALASQAAEPVRATAGDSVRLAAAALEMKMDVSSGPGGLLEVRALFSPRDGAGPMRIVMGMADGDAVAFGLPGWPSPLWRFARRGGTIEAAVDADEAPAIASR